MGKKYKLLIIDDEYFVIKGLRETIDWSALDIEIIAECNNGVQGLDAVHRLKPDLIISDIRMPIMDGLQLAEALSRENFDGAVIIYSGYGDFEYARKALESGVTRYLLKPIDNDTLVAKVREVLAELEHERSKRTALAQYEMGLPLLKENLILRLLEGKDPVGSAGKLASLGVGVPDKGIVIEASVLQPENQTNGGGSPFQSFYDSLLAALSDFQTLGFIKNDFFAVITEMTDITVLYNCIKDLLDKEQTNSDCRISVGISKPFDGAAGIAAAAKGAESLRKNVLFPSVNSINASVESGLKQHKQLIEDALAVIAADYGKKLSVKTVAERLYVSESHLMHEFKENLGRTFNECLTDFRLLKAKEMLAEGRLRINEIADRVGYADVRYFGQIFKEITGMSPKEYAESVKKR